MIAPDQKAPGGVVKDRVRGGVTGPVGDRERAVAQLDPLAVTQHPVHRRMGAPAAEGLRDRAQRAGGLGRDPVALHELDGVCVVGLGLLPVALHERLGHLARRDLSARAPADDVDEAQMIDVLVGEDHELEVPDRMAETGHSPLELIERAAGVWAGVDQRQRLVLDQVHVHPADGERRGDGEAMDPCRGRRGEGVLGRRRGAGGFDPAQDRIRPRTSSRRRSMSSTEASDSRLRRSSGSVFEGRTLKCHCSKSTDTPSSQPISAPACS